MVKKDNTGDICSINLFIISFGDMMRKMECLITNWAHKSIISYNISD